MEIGDYVRSKYYGIKKILNIYDNNTLKLDKIDSFGRMGVYEDIDDDMKSSPNIIDLIEVGDYVNGNKIVHIQEEKFPDYPKRLLFAGVDENNIDDVWEVYNNEDIKSIVTKEQFKRMQYNLESEVN